MASSVFHDPFQIWREALSKLENDANAFAAGTLKTQEALQAVHQVSSVSLGMQQWFEKTTEEYLRRANLPSRKSVDELATSLRRIEEKLDRLLSQEASAAPAPRPARTRRPPGAAAASEPASESAFESVSEAAVSEPAAAAKQTRRGARTRRG
ncbi:hypothetical protein [Paraburkholderia tagetis]|uniref:hypothetical protein n=1 Tax=Paraburkholderia tagetis TaxID=2913261 RepID=UPI001EE3D003|nr:hypothetical protein [Paraburkholderia tagetis]